MLLLSDDDLNKIQARIDQSSAGPWEIGEFFDCAVVSLTTTCAISFCYPVMFNTPAQAVDIMEDVNAYNKWHNDAVFIANARQDIPNLLETVKHQRVQIDNYIESIKNLSVGMQEAVDRANKAESERDEWERKSKANGLAAALGLERMQELQPKYEKMFDKMKRMERALEYIRVQSLSRLGDSQAMLLINSEANRGLTEKV